MPLQAYDFVHVRASLSHLGPIISCECQLFGLLEHSALGGTEAQDNEDSGWEGVSCCHGRLMQYLLTVKLFYHGVAPSIQPSQLLQAINNEKINPAFQKADSPVIRLNSKSGEKRFSIIANESPSFVTIFDILGTERNIISCHSSLCKMQQGHKRRLGTLQTSSVLCPHLTVFKTYYENLIFGDNNEMDRDSNSMELPDNADSDPIVLESNSLADDLEDLEAGG